MSPKVSIVITTFQGLETVERAIVSAISQTYDNTEIIVVDDNGVGSEVQQKTEEIVRKYKDIIYVAHEVNKNGSAARNTGIRQAKGKYVALLDDDDSFRSDKIRKQVDVLESLGDEYGICYTGMMIHFPNGASKEQITRYEGDIFLPAIMRKVKAQTSEFLIRKDAAIKIGCFDESFNRHQDWEFFDRMAYNYKVAVVPEVCIDRYIYKRTSASTPERYESNRLYYLKKMKPFIEKLSSNDQVEIYDFHYRSIAREYLKRTRIITGFKYITKCSSIIRTIKDLLNDYNSSSLS